MNQANSDHFDAVLRREYPLASMPRVPLPSARRPAWWRLVARSRWARQMDDLIAQAAIRGWAPAMSLSTLTKSKAGPTP